MKKICLLLPLIALRIPLTGHDYWCLNHHFHIFADYEYIRRQGGRHLPLVQQEQSQNQIETVVSSADLEKELGWESAVRGGVIYRADSQCSWEATYTYFYPWMAKRTVIGDSNLFFPFEDPFFGDDYQNAFQVDTQYETHLKWGEINYWGHVTPERINYFSFSWNLGFRWVDLREKLLLLFFRESDRAPYHIDTFNHLYGMQLGSMLKINPSRFWTWTFLVKGALFFNDARNEVKILDQHSLITIREYVKRRWTDSWLVEADGRLAYHLSSWLSAYFGYRGYLLTGVVLAPNQRDVEREKRRRINTKGQIIIDGPCAGLDLSF